MHKLTLDVESLEVQSFETEAPSDDRGTVRGHAPTLVEVDCESIRAACPTAMCLTPGNTLCTCIDGNCQPGSEVDDCISHGC